jgi:hypothetical protein
MRKALSFVVLAGMLAATPALAQSSNSGAGIPGQPGNKSGPAMTKSGSSSTNNSTTSTDQSKVPGMPGSKSGPAAKPPTKE